MYPLAIQLQRLRLQAAMLAVLAPVAGCGLLPHIIFDAPTVRVTGIALTALDLGGGTLAIRLDVYNPNPYALRGSGLTLDVELKDTHFGSASTSGPFELPAEEHAEMSLTAGFTWKGIGRAAGTFISDGRVTYKATGRAQFRGAAGERRIPIELTGQIGLEAP